MSSFYDPGQTNKCHISLAVNHTHTLTHTDYNKQLEIFCYVSLVFLKLTHLTLTQAGLLFQSSHMFLMSESGPPPTLSKLQFILKYGYD